MGESSFTAAPQRPSGRWASGRAVLRRGSGSDPLGLGRALPNTLLVAVALAMTLLAALALGGAAGAGRLAARWQEGAAAAVTVQLPDSDPGRQSRALAALAELPDLVEARPMDQARLSALLRPWLGEIPAMPLPPIIELRFEPLPANPEGLALRILSVVPGAQVETQGVWVARLVVLAKRVKLIGAGAAALVALLTATVVVVAVRAGLAARAEAIGVLHDLGASDGDIAYRYSYRAALLCGLGASLGLAVALPVLLAFSGMAGPLLGRMPLDRWQDLPWRNLPWPMLLALVPAVAGLGWIAAQVTVRGWLKRLP
jgi:cell division transport system permease protein